jgi:hypothetical protein
MPPRTSIRTFIRALQTGETKATRALTRVFTSPGELAGRGWFDEFQGNEGALDGPLPPYVRDELPELDEDDIGHMGMWPDTQKRILRLALVQAIQQDRNVRFFWELHAGSTSINEIANLTGEGDIVVTFRSPRANLGLAVTSISEVYDVSVDIESSGGDLI